MEKKAKFGFPASQAQNYTVADCRALVKTLVCGVKTITWGLTSTKNEITTTTIGNSTNSTTQFSPKETLVYIRMVKWAMEALDVYTLNTTPGQPGTTGKYNNRKILYNNFFHRLVHTVFEFWFQISRKTCTSPFVCRLHHLRHHLC